MKITNEQFTVRFAQVIETKLGSMANFYLAQECPRRPSRTIDFKLTINGGKAETAVKAMPVGSVVEVESGMVTNESYNRAPEGGKADWRDQLGVILTGKLKIISVGTSPEPGAENETAPHVDDSNLPF